jgi:hypothetical protein
MHDIGVKRRIWLADVLTERITQERGITAVARENTRKESISFTVAGVSFRY